MLLAIVQFGYDVRVIGISVVFAIGTVALRLMGALYLVGTVLGHAPMRYQLCDDVFHVLTDIHKFPR